MSAKRCYVIMAEIHSTDLAELPISGMGPQTGILGEHLCTSTAISRYLRGTGERESQMTSGEVHSVPTCGGRICTTTISKYLLLAATGTLILSVKNLKHREHRRFYF